MHFQEKNWLNWLIAKRFSFSKYKIKKLLETFILQPLSCSLLSRKIYLNVLPMMLSTNWSSFFYIPMWDSRDMTKHGFYHKYKVMMAILLPTFQKFMSFSQSIPLPSWAVCMIVHNTEKKSKIKESKSQRVERDSKQKISCSTLFYFNISISQNFDIKRNRTLASLEFWISWKCL